MLTADLPAVPSSQGSASWNFSMPEDRFPSTAIHFLSVPLLAPSGGTFWYFSTWNTATRGCPERFLFLHSVFSYLLLQKSSTHTLSSERTVQISHVWPQVGIMFPFCSTLPMQASRSTCCTCACSRQAKPCPLWQHFLP